MIMICGIFSFFLFVIRYELYISLEYLNEGAIKYLPIFPAKLSPTGLPLIFSFMSSPDLAFRIF